MNTFDGNVSSEFMKSGLIEVQGENGAFYPAYIFDVESVPSSSQLSTASGDSATQNAPSNAANVKSAGESLITVTFQNNSFPKSQFPISRIRLPPNNPGPIISSSDSIANNQEEGIKTIAAGISSVHLSNASPTNSNSNVAANSQPNATATNSEEVTLSTGMEVEVLSSCSKDEPRGWWRAIIKMIKGLFHT